MGRRSYTPSPPPPLPRGYGGRRARRSPSPMGRTTDLPTCLLVSYLPHDCRPEDLRRLFEQFGPLKDVYLREYSWWKKWVGHGNFVGYVHFVEPADAVEAKNQMDGHILLGKQLSVVLVFDIDHVTVSFARSSERGRQNVNKANTKVDMRYNVQAAHWLSEEIRDKILEMEKNRINKDGELVVSSTKTRTQRGNIEDALEKIQAIIEAAYYVPPPPSEEKVKKINELAAATEHKRIQNKKVVSQKKALRRSRDSYD